MKKCIRRRIGLALLIVGLFALTAAAQETYLGLLGETVEMSMFFGGQMETIDLYESPHETLSSAPEGEDIRYGFIKLGNGLDTRISLAVRLGPNPLIWIDANNNEDLLDDGAATPDVAPSQHEQRWYREVTVSYWEDGGHSTAPYVLRISALKFAGEWDFAYSCFCARKGLVQIGPSLHTIWLWDLDADGLFNDVEDLAIGIDNDGDGELTFDFSAPEWFAPGLPFTESGIVQIGDAFYEPVDVASDGRAIILAESKTDSDPLPILQPGYPAPLFEANTVAGVTIHLSNYLGRPLLMLFAPMFQLYPEHIDWQSDGFFGSSQPRSSGALRAMERTQQIIEEAIQWPDDLGFEILLVATDLGFLSPDTPRTLDQLDLPFPILWDAELSLQYRSIFHGALVIDQDGNIVARDGWSYRYDATGRLIHADLDPLLVMEISEILDSLVETDS